MSVDAWGVFEGDRFQVVLRNPLSAPAKVILNVDFERKPEMQLGSTERRALGESLCFATAWRHAHENSKSVPEFDITAVFEPVHAPLGPEAKAAGIKVVCLGKGRIGELDENGIRQAGNAAAREVIHDYLGGFGPDEVGREVSSSLLRGKTLEEAAAAAGVDHEDAQDVWKSLGSDRRDYLDVMIAEARSKVEMILRVANSNG